MGVGLFPFGSFKNKSEFYFPHKLDAKREREREREKSVRSAENRNFYLPFNLLNELKKQQRYHFPSSSSSLVA